jgi:hypothetical protein
MPRKEEKLLLKFDPDWPSSPKDHVKKIFLVICLLNVRHEDVVCRIFPYTFAGRASTWYFNLPPSSLTSWEDFEKAFIGNFGEPKTTAALYKELEAIKMEKREKGKDLNQRFITILTKFIVETTPLQSLSIEYYTSALVPSISMFVK